MRAASRIKLLLVTLGLSSIAWARPDAATGKSGAAHASVASPASPAQSAPVQPSSSAGDDAANVVEARRHFARGREFFDAQKFAAARVEIEEAYALAPNYRLLNELAICAEKQGDLVAAIKYVEEYLKTGAGQMDAEHANAARAELATLRDRVAWVTVTINVADADLQIDEEPRGKVSPEPVMVNPGRRKIWATRKGYYPASKELVLATAERGAASLVLNELPKVETRPSTSWLRVIAMYGVPAGLALVAVVIFAAARRRSARMASARIVALNPYATAVAEDEELEPGPEQAVSIVADPSAAAAPTVASAPLTLASASKTDVGRSKPTNQDSHFAAPANGLFMVADGIGGYAGGEVASAVAVDVVARAFEKGSIDIGKLTHLPRAAAELASAVFAANREIRKKAAENPNLADMGTTCVAARFVVAERRLYVAHVGDSRVYRMRGARLEQMTTDHTMAQLGLVGKRASHLARALGSEARPKVDILLAAPRPGDVYVLCCDGLCKMVSDADIAATLEANPDPTRAADALVALANHHGGADNITVIVVAVPG